MSTETKLVLLTGVSGYVGGRLLEPLLARGHRVRCLARRPESLDERVPARAEIVRGDVLDAESLAPALEGVDTAYYLVHSMGDSADFEERDRRAAETFAAAAQAAGIRRIVYLGGLGAEDEELSTHLRSRHEVGEIFRNSGVDTVELRASIVIGAGSLSFELVRALTERLPVMICPRWVDTPSQPISIADLIRYLVESMNVAIDGQAIFQVGGPDRVTYGDIMREYASQRGLRRWLIPVPVLTPHLSSLWLRVVTPVLARVGRCLVESLRNPTLVADDRAQTAFDIEPVGLRRAIARALEDEDHHLAEVGWSEAGLPAEATPAWGGAIVGTRIVDSRVTWVDLPPEQAFESIERIGGETGWYCADFLWQLRGWIDRALGGPGMSRGRSFEGVPQVGAALDCWRVERFLPKRRLRLSAEMKLPGRAWLDLEVRARDGGSTIRQTAVFDPLGIPGLLYWYILYIPHAVIFAGMLKGIAARSRTLAAAS